MTNDIRELSDAELNTVTGGGACSNAAALFKEARKDFANGDLKGGMAALDKAYKALKTCLT